MDQKAECLAQKIQLDKICNKRHPPSIYCNGSPCTLRITMVSRRLLPLPPVVGCKAWIIHFSSCFALSRPIDFVSTVKSCATWLRGMRKSSRWAETSDPRAKVRPRFVIISLDHVRLTFTVAPRKLRKICRSFVVSGAHRHYTGHTCSFCLKNRPVVLICLLVKLLSH